MTDKPLTKVIKKIISHERGCLTCRSPDCPVWQAADQNCWKSQADNDAQVAKKEREKVRPEVWQFALLMEKKLKENDHKSHWSKCNQEYLLKRLDEEVEELHKCFFFYSPGDMNFFMDGQHEDKIPGEAVDVANFAMMLWDNFGEKESMRGEP